MALRVRSRVDVATVVLAAAVLARLPVTVWKARLLQRPGVLRVPWFGDPVEPVWIWPAVVAWAVGGLLMLGTGTRRVGCWTAGFGILGFLLTDRQLYSNHLYLIMLLCALLALAQSEPTPWVTAVRVQITVMYVFAGLTKLNPGFLSGEPLASFIAAGPLPIRPDLITPTWVVPLAAAVPPLEVFVGVGLWSRRLRPWAIGAGIVFHVGTILGMGMFGELIPFFLAAAAGYLLFLPEERVLAVSRRLPLVQVSGPVAEEAQA
ncbi:MAG: hypothetical protein KatS3mg011_1986 [Acidimicrobiia bacterium]|nr:MAG: hypothetical protein KatS3mg011_1986 [Acidimicrobiia bacterium]